MKTRISALLAACATLLFLIGPLVGAADAAQRAQEFKQKFRQAMSINARDEMAKLVREYQDEAATEVITTCEQIAIRPTEELEETIDALRKAWKQSFNTGFVDSMYEYFSLLDPPTKREQQRIFQRWIKADARFKKLSGTGDGPGLELLGIEFGAISKGFEQVGDKYHASQAWLVYAECFDEPERAGKADLKKTTKGIGRALELRREIELDDSWYRNKKSRYDFLAAQGWSDEEGAVEGPSGAGATADGATGAGPGAGPANATPAAAKVTLAVPMTFAVIESVDEVLRPQYNADTLYQMWSALYFQKKGSKARFPSLKDGPDFIRNGSADVRWDVNGNGTVDDDQRLPMTGNLEPVEVTIGKGAEERPWAFLMVTGLQKDRFQYVGEINLAPDDNQMSVFSISAASMTGELNEIPLRVIDDNMDGIYGSLPLSWAYSGISADVYQPDMDSIVIDDGKRALPWSEFQKIGEQWYKLEAKNGGKTLTAEPVEVPTGTLKLKFKGGKPTWVVVKGANKYENCYFDVVGGGSKGVEVPVGQYQLFYGELRKGKKAQTAKSLILPGTKTPKWNVVAGETTEIELGAPFGFDFRTSRSGDTVNVIGQSVVVIGKADERYERTWNAVPRPEVSWRKAGGKRGSKGERMDPVMDLDGITKHTFRGAWSPLDITLEVKGIGDDDGIEFRLIEKKNPLFGKIESDWRE